ncbi:MAG: hypothetical protein IPO40_19200 [Fibrobacteres bacterium]|nr:hypothetical protein [Fibrobacterota bacterium]
MQIRHVYMCDHGHHWAELREESVPEQSGRLICPEGHEAVTDLQEIPIDVAELTIRSLTFVSKFDEQPSTNLDQFEIVVRDRRGALAARSVPLTMTEAASKIKVLIGKRPDDAVLWLSKMSILSID